jgi:hypothetical protein
MAPLTRRSEISTSASRMRPNFLRTTPRTCAKSWTPVVQKTGGAQRGAAIVRPLLRLIQLERTTSSTVDTDQGPVLVGAGIPPFVSMTIELVMNNAQARLHYMRNLAIISEGLGRPGDDDDEGRDAGLIRRLRHLTISPWFEDAFHTLPLNAPDVTKMHATFGDSGLQCYNWPPSRISLSSRTSTAGPWRCSWAYRVLSYVG